MNIKAISFVGKALKTVAANGFKSSKSIISPITTAACDTVSLSSRAIASRVAKSNIRPALKALKPDIKILREIFKLDNPNEFITTARAVICKQHGIPFGLYPEIIPVNSGALAAYLHNYHVIQISNEAIEFFNQGIRGKKKLWMALVHELEHARQNLQILSTPGIAEKAIKNYARMRAKYNYLTYKNLPIEQVEAIIKAHPNEPNMTSVLKKIVEARKSGTEIPTKLEKETLKTFYTDAIKFWGTIRQKAKKFIEPILPNTEAEKESITFFKGFTSNVPYDKSKSFLGNLKYFLQLHEMSAYEKQYYVYMHLNI